tara:strand:+ start:187 stop:1206 length:1020 start_codon:yes stop_codon:yes gene_type:complete
MRAYLSGSSGASGGASGGSSSKAASARGASTPKLQTYDEAVASGTLVLTDTGVSCKCSPNDRKPPGWGPRACEWKAHCGRIGHQDWARAQRGKRVLTTEPVERFIVPDPAAVSVKAPRLEQVSVAASLTVAAAAEAELQRQELRQEQASNTAAAASAVVASVSAVAEQQEYQTKAALAPFATAASAAAGALATCLQNDATRDKHQLAVFSQGAPWRALAHATGHGEAACARRGELRAAQLDELSAHEYATTSQRAGMHHATFKEGEAALEEAGALQLSMRGSLAGALAARAALQAGLERQQARSFMLTEWLMQTAEQVAQQSARFELQVKEINQLRTQV